MRPVFAEENLNLLELGTEIVRESFTAARRLKMYEPEHPTVASVCERSFFLFKKWFRLRQTFSKTQKLLLTSNPLSDTAKILLSKLQK